MVESDCKIEVFLPLTCCGSVRRRKSAAFCLFSEATTCDRRKTTGKTSQSCTVTRRGSTASKCLSSKRPNLTETGCDVVTSPWLARKKKKKKNLLTGKPQAVQTLVWIHVCTQKKTKNRQNYNEHGKKETLDGTRSLWKVGPKVSYRNSN